VKGLQEESLKLALEMDEKLQQRLRNRYDTRAAIVLEKIANTGNN
jgi:hypothetical protein